VAISLVEQLEIPDIENKMAPNNDPSAETLLTKKSLQLSLSAPRCPPHGTAHRSFLVGKDPSGNPFVDHDHDHDDNQAHSGYNRHSGLRERLSHLLQRSHFDIPLHHRIPHPHLAPGPEVSDQMSRFLGTILPLSWQNSFRDSGGFRSTADTLVTWSIPVGAVTNPSAAAEFLRLTRKVETIPYGDHEMQFIDMFLPECPEAQINGLIFFAHGGAWGSGKPWFYRLTATPFLKMNLAVAIVGYRTYPSGDLNVQVDDLELAALELSKRYPKLCGAQRIRRSIGTCVMGHSSGAHLALVMLVERAKRLLHLQEAKLQNPGGENTTSVNDGPSMPVDSFVGISGPYNISHHFDYEAARGVEEISPLKPACGYSREQFRRNSPALKLVDFLASFQECDNLALDNFLPKMLLIHGIEDDTVPFTSTGEAAHILRACGITKCDEIYLPETGHQDAVMHVMLGGRTRNAILDWLEHPKKERHPPLASKL
jgi:acetyl esterase/lipase